MARTLKIIEPDFSYLFDKHSRNQGPEHELPPDFDLHSDEYEARESGKRSLWKGALAGAVAGLAAGWVMVKFQELYSNHTEGDDKKHSVPEHRAEGESGDDKVDENEVDATVRIGNHVSKALFKYELSRSDAELVGPAVHYTFSAAMGALYGGLGEVAPVTRMGFGNVFGALLFVGADEIAVPALGLSKGPLEVPLSKHLYGLISHLVYASTTEGLYRGTRKALEYV